MESVILFVTKLPSSFFVQISIILASFLILFKKWLNSQNHRLPPSPPGFPIIGNLHQMGPIPMRSLKTLADKLGPVMLFQLGSSPAVVISSAVAAEQVLKKNDLIFADRAGFNFVAKLSYGSRDIFFSPYGEHWKQLRAIFVSQLLSNKRIQSFRSLRESEVLSMFASMMEYIPSSICNMSAISSALTYNIATRVAIGKRHNNGSEFKSSIMACAKMAGSKNIGDSIPWLGWINFINGVEKKMNDLQKELDACLESIVEQTIKRQADEDDEQNFLSLLLQFQREDSTLDRDSIKAIVLDLVFAGIDSTSSLIEWAFSELMRNPNVMSKLKKEVRSCKSHEGGHEKVMIMEDEIGKLSYLKAVIRETLRMHPPVGIFNRQSRNAVEIQGYNFAPKTKVLINVWAIGRDPRYWEEPDEFRPERFLGENPVDIMGQHFQYLPFGSGRRVCAGYGLALGIAELALANLVWKFNFELAHGVKPEELDMTESHGTVNPRKFPLLVVPSLPSLVGGTWSLA